MKIQLVPTLLTYTKNEFELKLRLLEKYFSLFQIDVMDNKFVNNKTFVDLGEIKEIKTKANYEVHLMVKNPEKYVKEWVRFKKVKKIIFHLETSSSDTQKIINLIKKCKIKVGIAINPKTKVTEVERFMSQIDTVLLMSVEPGFGGQRFKSSALEKAKYLRKNYPNKNIEIDGGVNKNNLQKIVKSGVNIISGGGLFYKTKDIKKNILNLKSLVK